MGRQIPKNVRQIGNVSDSPKIYVEDYVDTFFQQLCEKTKEGPVGAFLVGDMQKTDDEEYVYIYGAIQMHDLKMGEEGFVIDDDTWKKGFEDCKQFFDDREMLGWFVAREGSPILPDAQTVRLHKKSFPKKNTVFITKDALEKEEAYYVQKFNDLMEVGGHYTFYEKNPSMQNYMIASRKKNGVCPSETVEDRAAKDFRSIVKGRASARRKKKLGPAGAAAGLCFVTALALILAATLNNMRKMNSVQNALDEIAKRDEEHMRSVEANADLTGKPENDVIPPPPVLPKQDDTDKGGKPVSVEIPGDDRDSDDGHSDDITPPKDNGTDEPDIVPNGHGSESGRVYVVEEGDTLVQISKKIYDDFEHVDVICRVNGLPDGNLIYIGQKLVLP